LTTVLAGRLPALSSRSASWTTAAGLTILMGNTVVTLATVVGTYGLF